MISPIGLLPDSMPLPHIHKQFMGPLSSLTPKEGVLHAAMIILYYKDRHRNEIGRLSKREDYIYSGISTTTVKIEAKMEDEEFTKCLSQCFIEEMVEFTTHTLNYIRVTDKGKTAWIEQLKYMSDQTEPVDSPRALSKMPTSSNPDPLNKHDSQDNQGPEPPVPSPLGTSDMPTPPSSGRNWAAMVEAEAKAEALENGTHESPLYESPLASSDPPLGEHANPWRLSPQAVSSRESGSVRDS
jgi:hypothetical protein